MRKFLSIIFLTVFAFGFVGAANAEDTFYCDCTGSTEKIGGQTCVMFTSSTEADAFCSKCSLTKEQPAGVLCTEYGGNVPAASSGSGAATPDSGKTVKLSNPLAGDVTDVNAIIGNIIKAAMGVMGALVLLMIVYGGVTWLTAAGSPEKVKSGSNMILWAILGAVVVLGSYLLLMGVLKGLAG